MYIHKECLHSLLLAPLFVSAILLLILRSFGLYVVLPHSFLPQFRYLSLGGKVFKK